MTNVNGVNSAGYQIKVYPIVPTAGAANDLTNRQQSRYQDSRRKLPEQDVVEISKEYREIIKSMPSGSLLPEYSDVAEVINNDSVRGR